MLDPRVPDMAIQAPSQRSTAMNREPEPEQAGLRHLPVEALQDFRYSESSNQETIIIMSRKQRPFLISLILVIFLAACSAEQNKTPAQSILDALAALDARKPSMAIIELKNAIQRHPRDPYLRAELASTFLKIGDAESAEIEARKARELGFDATKADMLIAEALVNQSEYSAAYTLLESFGDLAQIKDEQKRQLLMARTKLFVGDAQMATEHLQRADQGDAAVQVTNAQLIAMAGDTERAIDVLQQVLELHPSNAAAWSLLGDIRRFQGNTTDALSAYDKSIELGLNTLNDRWQRALLNLREGNFDAAKPDITVLRGRNKEQPQAAFLEGVVQIQKGDYANAQALLQTAQGKAPNFLPAAYYLAVTHYKLGEYNLAEQYLSQYTTARPDDITGRELRALNLWELGDVDEAVEQAQAIRERDSLNPFALELLSMHALHQGDAKAAVGSLEKLRSSNLQAGDAIDLRLGLSYLSAGQEKQGVDALEQLAAKGGAFAARADEILILKAIRDNRLQQALEMAREMQTKHPDLARPFTLAGTAMSAMGDDAGAVAAFEKAWALEHGDAVTGRSLARIHVKRGDIERAIELYREIIQTHPESTITRLELAGTLKIIGDQEGFTHELNEATRENPSDPRPWLLLLQQDINTNNVAAALQRINQIPEPVKQTSAFLETAATAHLKGGDPRVAAQAFSRLVTDFPDNPQFRLQFAQALSASGEGSRAYSTLESAAQRFPGHVNLNVALASVELSTGKLDRVQERIAMIEHSGQNPLAVAVMSGRLAVARGDIPKAAASMEEAYRLSPSMTTAFPLVSAYSAVGRIDDAMKLAHQWAEKEPDNLPLLLILADLYSKRDDNQQAAKTYRRVLTIQPKHPLANNNLAWALLNSDPAAALQHAERAYQAAPQSSAIADTYGWTLHMNRQSGRALEILEKAAQDPKAGESLREHLAVVRGAVGSR